MVGKVYTIFELCEHEKDLGKCGICKEQFAKEFETFQDVKDELAWGSLIRSVANDQMHRGE